MQQNIAELTTRRRLLYGVTFFVGASVMGAEIAAARLVAPFYGTSTMVWALVIGATLLSLSVGQLLGGWLSRRGIGDRGIVGLLLASAVILVTLPFIGRPLMEQSLTFFWHEAYGTIAASALGVTALIGFPLIFLGAVGPLILQEAISDAKEAGSVGGYLYAWGTIGSLLGTYTSGLLFIPIFGTSRTLWIFSALIVLGAALFIPRKRWRLGLGSAALIAFIAGFIIPTGPIKATPGQIFEAETAHNYIEVVEERGVRRLYFNEGFAEQSIYIPGRLALHNVWGYYGLAPAWTTTGSPSKVLMLGLGGGTAARVYRELYPDAEIVGVELDGEVIEAGRRFMGMPEDIETVAADARIHLAREERHFDVIIVDAFQFPYIPFQLCTREFFSLLHARLAPGGMAMLNVGRDGENREVVYAILRTLGEVFPYVYAVDVPSGYNTIVIAMDHPIDEAVGVEGLVLPSRARASFAYLADPTTWRIPANAPLLTDDHAPVELLTDLVFLRRLLPGF
ncbi:MAG: spermidine synthase [Bradymonadaceae bacterium]